MERYLMISDAAKEVRVESHVLRYWEEELHLPIRRNELGHRYYTEGDVELFKQIKSMKERGLQLKAIKMILKDGKLDVVQQKEEEEVPEEDSQEEISSQEQTESDAMAIQVIGSRKADSEQKLYKRTEEEMKDEKAKRLQWLLQQLIRETLQENNKELCREIKESVVKELDYQFRIQDEREEERDRVRIQREEEYYKKLDEILRKKARKDKKKNVGEPACKELSAEQEKKTKKNFLTGNRKLRILHLERPK